MKFVYSFIFMMLPLTALISQIPVINNLDVNDATIGQFNKWEAKVSLTATYTNPYDYNEIQVQGVFTSPEGNQDTVDGFFMQDYTLNTNSGGLSLVENGDFYVRFTPRIAGDWTFSITVQTATGTSAPYNGNFTVLASNEKGFIRTAENSHYLEYDNGDQYIPVGQNLAWQAGNPYLDYKKWLEKMVAENASYMRLWLCSWGLGLEWQDGINGYNGLKKYKQSNAFYIDWLLEKCHETGISMMFCMNHHGQVSSQVNPNWNENPYNASNGGPCLQTSDFFTDPVARELHKNRLRYIVARWGFSTNIMSWELFNEVNYTDGFETDSVRTAVRNWHDEMSQYLKTLDAYQHLVTTSFGSTEDPGTWELPAIDFTQTHTYTDDANIERVLAEQSRDKWLDYGKPTLNGEFGINTNNINFQTIDPDGIHLHNSYWATAFSGAMGAGANWWWESYVDPADLYYHFSALSNMLELAQLKNGSYAPVDIAPMGATGSGSLTLVPAVDWGQTTASVFTISSDGSTSPDASNLGKYLYGSEWNTQYRNPPSFYVNYPVNGQFIVNTGNSTGQAPSVAIYIDNLLVQNNATAAINTTYSVDITAGTHTIKVDNLGTDWINIASYKFAGISPAPLNIHALQSISSNRNTGWVHNPAYNWKDAVNNPPPPVAGAYMNIGQLDNGNAYDIIFYNCLNGNVLDYQPGIALQNGVLKVEIPEIVWDAAYMVAPQGEITVATLTPGKGSDSMILFPNPVSKGADLQVVTQGFPLGIYTFEIISIQGQLLKKWETPVEGSNVKIGTSDLESGMYILKIHYQNWEKVQKFIVH